MRRAVSALCLCALIAVMAACETAGRAVIRTPLGYFELEFQPWALHDGTACGTVEIDQRVYTIYCDSSGEPVYVAPEEAPNRHMRLSPLTELETPLPESALIFDIENEPFAMMRLPETLLDFELQGTAAELLDDHGVVSNGPEHDVPFTCHYDAGEHELDLRVALSSDVQFPSPFVYDLRQETIVVLDNGDGPAFVLHRVVGSVGEVARYVRAAGLIDVTPTPTLTDGSEYDVSVDAPLNLP